MAPSSPVPSAPIPLGTDDSSVGEVLPAELSTTRTVIHTLILPGHLRRRSSAAWTQPNKRHQEGGHHDGQRAGRERVRGPGAAPADEGKPTGSQVHDRGEHAA